MSTDQATEFGVAKTTIITVPRESNVVQRRQSLTPEQVMDATVLHESGRSLSQIAEQQSLKQDTIRLALKAAGVKLRPASGATIPV
ncbi:hypothetical protein QE430_003300 [Microbacterium testaceum]|uniref:hypothetical protein n=1 Tax=Microbacterium testaceum TaxID=2033 RepID=UPI0027849B66|nr:hypothetical protein [Microbacterium testaceum]MDQ1174993.1 hypothetical protein [Microbacterium testaceum]